MMTIDTGMISAIKAAEEIGVHRNTIRRWFETGRIGGVRRGRRLKVFRADLARMVRVQLRARELDGGR